MKKVYLIVVVVLTVLVLWLMRPNPEAFHAAAPAAVPVAPADVVIAEAPSPRMQALQRAPRQPLQVKPEDKVAPECVAVWTKLRALNLSEAFTFPPKPEALTDVSGCGTPPLAVASVHARYLQDCKDMKQRFRAEMTGQEWSQAVAPCYMAATLYRATLTDWMTRDQKLSDITDPQVLSDKLAAKIFTDPGTAAEVAERLLEVEPDLYPAAKISAVARLMDAEGRAKGDPANPIWGKLDDRLAEAAKRNPNDRSLVELEFVSEMLRARDPRDLDAKLQTLKEKNPALADYYGACIENKTGNQEEAIRRLQEMIARGTRDPRIAATLDKMQKGMKDACQSTFTFPIDAVGAPPTPKAS